MAETLRPIEVSITYTPAFYALLHCAELIAEAEGQDFATEWGGEIIHANPSLFCIVELVKRPTLRLVQG